MSLGLCCQFLESRTKRDGTIVHENAIDERSLQLGRYKSGAYTNEYIRDLFRHNADQIIKLVPKLAELNIKSFRLSSTFLTLFDLVSEIPKGDDVLKAKLRVAGDLFKKHGIRVTTHPGQYTVLSSDSDAIINKSIIDLAYHAWVFDQMGFDCTPYYAINIHGGKSDRANKLIETIKRLPQNIGGRLTLENDESAYSLLELLPVHKATGVPLVWDSHHFTFNDDNLKMEDAYTLSMETWSKTGIKPLQHISNTTPGLEKAKFMDKRKHSDFIHYVPECQLAGIKQNLIDIDVEAKMKNLALLKMRKDFDIQH
jgi:UV DNA damage endonuclease